MLKFVKGAVMSACQHSLPTPQRIPGPPRGPGRSEIMQDMPPAADARVAIAIPDVAGGSHLAHSAFWIMVRRVTLGAATVDLGMLFLFLALGSPVLAWINVASIALYGIAYWLITRRINTPAIMIIWIEVLGHAALGSLLAGWDSGFHYYLLMFIPAIVVSSRKGHLVLVAVLLAFYLGLHAVCRHYGALQPLSDVGLAIVHGFNVTIVFLMASYTARFYYATVRRAERKLVEMASRDPLTGLANRRHLLALAEHEIARTRRSGEPLSLIIADIDHFKRINDQRGHETGDQVLRHVAATLTNLCRAQDVVARWGGEEFLLLLPGTNAEAATMLAERIRASVATSPLPGDDAAVTITLSLGVALLKPDEEVAGAIARADRALYRSKEGGRDRVTAGD